MDLGNDNDTPAAAVAVLRHVNAGHVNATRKKERL
jgi:hypothetical protein